MTYEQLIAHFKTQKAAGDALKAFGPNEGVSQPSVAEWKDSGIPLPRQAQFELITAGALKADMSDEARAKAA